MEIPVFFLCLKWAKELVPIFEEMRPYIEAPDFAANLANDGLSFEPPSEDHSFTCVTLKEISEMEAALRSRMGVFFYPYNDMVNIFNVYDDRDMALSHHRIVQLLRDPIMKQGKYVIGIGGPVIMPWSTEIESYKLTNWFLDGVQHWVYRSDDKDTYMLALTHIIYRTDFLERFYGARKAKIAPL